MPGGWRPATGPARLVRLPRMIESG